MLFWAVTSVESNSWWPYRLKPTRLLCPWYSLGKNSEVGCHALSSRGSFRPRDWTLVSYTARRVLTAELPGKPPHTLYLYLYSMHYSNTCHLQCGWSVNILCESVSHSAVSHSLWPHRLKPTRLLCPWNSPGKNTGVGCHSLLQGIFPTQGSNPGLLHCRQILYHLNLQGSKHLTCSYKSNNWK